MRRLGWLLVLLAAVGWLATEVRLPETPAAPDRPLDSWRRTPDGWQRATWLAPQTPIRRPALHPVVVGLLELLVCLAALVAFPTGAETGAAYHAGSHADSHAPPPAPGQPALGFGERSPIGPAGRSPERPSSPTLPTRGGAAESRSG
ncbi:MAG TPA: hypothetical protein VMY37_15415 [Thermoguttaceae bacterium]|nr:hypothetical protein [Thermoguttaceae bacterium]